MKNNNVKKRNDSVNKKNKNNNSKTHKSVKSNEKAVIKNPLHVKEGKINGDGTYSPNLGLRILIIVLAFIFVVIAAFSVIVLVVGGLFSQKEYLSVWDKSYYTQFQDDRLKLVSHGLLAPNNYNMQPWLIELDKEHSNVFYLYANTERLFLSADKKAAKTIVTLGVFLEYISIAGQQLGLETSFEYFPKGSLDEANLLSSLQNLPIAKVTIANTDVKIQSLYNHIFKPATNRGVYTDEKVAPSVIESFTNANSYDKVKLSVYQNQEDINRIAQIIMQAIYTEVELPAVMNERGLIFQSNNFEKNKNKFGVSLDNYGDKGIWLAFKQGIVTLFPDISKDQNAKNEVISQGHKNTENMPNFIIIETIGNERTSQIQAGRVYARVVLLAHENGFVVQPLSYPIQDINELNDVKQLMHDEFSKEGNRIQMMFRMGKPMNKAPNSMRIPTDKILKT